MQSMNITLTQLLHQNEAGSYFSFEFIYILYEDNATICVVSVMLKQSSEEFGKMYHEKKIETIGYVTWPFTQNVFSLFCSRYNTNYKDKFNNPNEDRILNA